MAGDWIKVRTNLRDDPRVMSIADSLGVSDAEVLGALVMFWSWADAHTEDGLVRNLSRSRADKIGTLVGFSEELVRIGWAEIDKNTGEMTLINFAEHNGNSAKKRAVDSKRKATNRVKSKDSEKCPKSVTQGAGQNSELEKRREEKSIIEPAAAVSTPLPPEGDESGNPKPPKKQTKKFTPPEYAEFEKYLLEAMPKVNPEWTPERISRAARLQFDTFEGNKWKDGFNKPFTNWKNKTRNILSTKKPYNYGTSTTKSRPRLDGGFNEGQSYSGRTIKKAPDEAKDLF